MKTVYRLYCIGDAGFYEFASYTEAHAHIKSDKQYIVARFTDDADQLTFDDKEDTQKIINPWFSTGKTPEAPQVKNCECGAAKLNSSVHSEWCPKHG